MSETPSWLSEFFQADNSICLESVLKGDYDQVSQGLFSPLVVPASMGQWPFVLPLKTKSGRELFFYGGAQNARKLSELRSVMRAFLGTADVSPDLPLIKQPETIAEQALLKRSPQGIIKVTLLDQSDAPAKKRVYQAFAKLLELYEERPDITVDLIRPTGRILRDFFSACSVRDGAAAFSFYEELKGSGRVSRRNLLSLELQALAAGKQWQDILDHSQLSDLLQGRVPIRVTILLLRAMGHSGLYDLCDSHGLSGPAIDSAREMCSRLGPLFLSPPAIESSSSFEDDWKIWAVGASVVGTPGYSKDVPDFIDRDWLASLAEWTGTTSEKVEPSNVPTITPKTDDLNAATQLLQQSLTASPSELEEIVAQIEALPEETLARLEQFPRLSELWGSLKAERRASDGGWSSWVEQITQPGPDIGALEQECINSSPYWTSDTFDPDQIRDLLESNNVEEIGIMLRNILPILLSWLDEREIPCTATFWGVWANFLALDDVVTHQDVVIAENILTNFLEQPHTRNEYKQVVEAVELLWEKGSSVSNYCSMLDVVELLLESSCPDTATLNKLWQSTQAFSLQKWNRLEAAQQHLSKSLACEILGEECLASYPNESSAEDSEKTADVGPDLGGKLVAIYTLTEGAGRRAKAILEGLFKGLSVETNSDHVATSSLTTLAKKADYFIFSANSSKHQAFYPVSKIRSDLIYPQGKGSSSIINAFLTQVAS
jgi:hypothetical protein